MSLVRCVILLASWRMMGRRVDVVPASILASGQMDSASLTSMVCGRCGVNF